MNEFHGNKLCEESARKLQDILLQHGIKDVYLAGRDRIDKHFWVEVKNKDGATITLDPTYRQFNESPPPYKTPLIGIFINTNKNPYNGYIYKEDYFINRDNLAFSTGIEINEHNTIKNTGETEMIIHQNTRQKFLKGIKELLDDVSGFGSPIIIILTASAIINLISNEENPDEKNKND